MKEIAAALARVRHGVEVVVEQDHRAVAVIKSPASLRPDDLHRGDCRTEGAWIECGYR